MNTKFKPGQSGNPDGRPKGSENKVKADVKSAIRQIVENNINNIEFWIQQTAKKDPGRAVELIAKFLEFTIPKLLRSEDISTRDQYANLPSKPMTVDEMTAYFRSLRNEFDDETK